MFSGPTIQELRYKRDRRTVQMQYAKDRSKRLETCIRYLANRPAAAADPEH